MGELVTFYPSDGNFTEVQTKDEPEFIFNK